MQAFVDAAKRCVAPPFHFLCFVLFSIFRLCHRLSHFSAFVLLSVFRFVIVSVSFSCFVLFSITDCVIVIRTSRSFSYLYHLSFILLFLSSSIVSPSISFYVSLFNLCVSICHCLFHFCALYYFSQRLCHRCHS